MTTTVSPYNHKFSVANFISVFTASDEEFTRDVDTLGNAGISSLTGEAIKDKHKVDLGAEYYNKQFVLFFETELEANGQPIILTNSGNFKQNILFLKSHISVPIIIKSSDLSNVSFHILESKISDVTVQEQSKTGNIRIQKSTTGNFQILESEVGDFYIQGESLLGNFDIKQSKTGDFYIKENSSTGPFFIENKKNVCDININQSKIASFSIEESVIGRLIIDQKSTILGFDMSKSIVKHFDIKQSIIEYLNIEKCITEVFAIKSSECKSFDATELIVLVKFTLDKSSISPFQIKKSSKINELHIASGCKAECYIIDSAINLIHLQNTTLSRDSLVSFFDCDVYACLMDKFVVLGNLFFRQVRVMKAPFTLPFEDEKNYLNAYNKVLLSQLKELDKNYDPTVNDQHGDKIKESTLRIVQSSLGKTEFTDCNLDHFRLEFNNAKITEVFISGGTVPQNNIFIYGRQAQNNEENEALKQDEQKVSFYNQLKKIFDGQGDIYWATHFQSKTAEHQQKLLRLLRKQEKNTFKNFPFLSLLTIRRAAWKKLISWFSTTFWDLKTFQLNQLSNLHGESWGRALVFTLVAPLLFYILFLVTVGCIYVPPNLNWHTIYYAIDGSFIGYYFTFLDPTHKIDFLKDKGATLTGSSSFIDFLGRIVVGYGIYQFIAAFRKHGKK